MINYITNLPDDRPASHIGEERAMQYQEYYTNCKKAGVEPIAFHRWSELQTKAVA